MPGLSIGSAYARLGAQLDDEGFNRFDKRLQKAQRDGDHGATAKLRVDGDQAAHGLDQYSRGVKEAGHQNDEFVRGSARLRTGLGSLFVGGAGFALATTGFYALAKGAKFAFDQFKQSQQIARQTAAVIKSTGGEAGITAKQVSALATAISQKTGIDDEAVQSTENLLLTFTNLRNEAGKGNDIFNQTTKLVQDMSVALGQDGKSSAIQLGKALNDPVKGITALSRVGVSFTKQQKDQIKTLVDSGKTLDAQKVILKEVTKEFGGSAERVATSGGKLKVTLGNVAEFIGSKVSPYFETAANWTNKFLTQLLDGQGAGGKFGQAIKTGFTIAANAISAVVKAGTATLAFLRNNKDVQAWVNNVKRLFALVVPAIASIGQAFAKTFKGVGPELETIGKAILKVEHLVSDLYIATVQRAIPGIVKTFKGLATVVRGVVDIIAGILHGDFGQVWEGVKKIVSGALAAIEGTIRTATAPIREVFSLIWKGLGAGVSAAFGGVKTVLTDVFKFIAGGASSILGIIGDVVNTASKVPFVGGKFKGLADDIKGAQHSIDNYRDSLNKTNDAHDRTNDRLDAQRDKVAKLQAKLSTLSKGTDSYRSTAKKLQGAQDDLNTSIANTSSAGTKGAKGIDKIGGAAGGALDTVIAAGIDIAKNVNALGKGLGGSGFKPVSYTPAHADAGASASGHAGFERGGYLGAQGLRGADTELVLAAPGEAFLTHHQQGPVEAALAFANMMGLPVPASLDGVFGDRRSHQFQSGGRFRGRRFASGGFTPAPGTNYSVGQEPEIASRLQRLAVALGIRLTGISGYRTPQHSVEVGGFANDPHTRGAASDTPGVEGVSEAVLERYGLARPFPGAAEADHIQLLGSGGGGPVGALGGGLGGASLALGTVTGAGAFGAVVSGAVKRMGAAARAKVGGLGGSGGGGATSAGGSYNKAALRALWIRNGGAAAAANLAAAVALAESGGNPNSTNHNTNGTVDRGLWQINSIHGALSVYDPDANARAAIKISSNGRNWAPWVTYNTGAYRKFFARGGRLGRAFRRFAQGGRLGLQRFNTGGFSTSFNPSFSPRPTTTASTRAPIPHGHAVYHDTGYIGLRRLQGDRIGAYDSLIKGVDDANTNYSILDRRYSEDDTELINDDGTLNQPAIDRKANELLKLAIIRHQIADKLTQARDVTKRIIGTYSTLIKRLTESRQYSKGKNRDAIDNTIKAYRGRIKEWDSTRRELTLDKIPNAQLDERDILKERGGVLGTKANTPDTTPSPDTSLDLGSDPGSGSGDTSSGDTSAAPPSAEDIATGVAQALAAFNQSRSDLFAQFGSNFATGYVQGDETALAAGVRNYGATGAGDAQAGGAFNPVDQAGGQTKPAVSITNNYAAPPPDPHTWSQDLGFELAATL